MYEVTKFLMKFRALEKSKKTFKKHKKIRLKVLETMHSKIDYSFVYHLFKSSYHKRDRLKLEIEMILSSISSWLRIN